MYSRKYGFPQILLNRKYQNYKCMKVFWLQCKMNANTFILVKKLKYCIQKLAQVWLFLDLHELYFLRLYFTVSLDRLLYLEIQFRHTHIISNKSIWKWPFLSKLAPNRLNSFFISKHSASISKQGFPVPKLLSSGPSKWTPAAPYLSYGPAEWTRSFMCVINSSKSTVILWTFMMSDIKHSIFRLIV